MVFLLAAGPCLRSFSDGRVLGYFRREEGNELVDIAAKRALKGDIDLPSITLASGVDWYGVHHRGASLRKDLV